MNLKKYNPYALMGLAMATVLTSPLAMATGGGGASALSAGLQAEADTAKTELWVIGGIVVGVCFIGFLIGRGKRTSS